VNDFLTARPLGAPSFDFSKRVSVPSHSETMWMGEMLEDIISQDHFHFADFMNSPYPGDVTGGYSPNGFRGQVNVLRHEGSALYLFLDGHVDSLKWVGLPARLTNSGNRFVMPIGRP
jgi:prepilin-type processing-associated H-X9-DG protein